MLEFFKHLFYIFSRFIPDFFRPFNKFLRCPVSYKLMARCKVILKGCIPKRARIPFVAGDFFIMIVDLYFCLVIKQLYFLTDIIKGYAVIMLIHAQTYMVVFHYSNDLFMLNLKMMYWQWLKFLTFCLFKQHPAAIGPSFHHSVVMCLKSRKDVFI